MDYKLQNPIYTKDGSYANAVYVNQKGEWLAEWDHYTCDDGIVEIKVSPLCDKDGDFIPAPDNWRDRGGYTLIEEYLEVS